MNLTTSKIVLILIGLCSLTIAIAEEPVQKVIADEAVVTSRNGVVSGVLGYTEQCGYALYADRMSALARDTRRAVMLELDVDGNAIAKGVPLGAYINSYVIASGKPSEKNSAEEMPALRKAEVYYSFSSPFEWTDTTECKISSHTHIFDIIDIWDARIKSEPKIRISGVLEKEPSDVQEETGVYRLYSNAETARENVWTHGIIVFFVANIPICVGREVVVEGTPKERSDRTQTHLAMVNATLIASACGKQGAKQKQ